jgi:hypothetical protein
MALADLITFYEELTPQSVERFADFYSSEAYFKDPFNEVRGLQAIEKIFTHMYRQIADPKFSVTETLVAENGVMLVWALSFRIRTWNRGQMQVMRGVSHLRFDADGKVNYHRDYWDTAEELYMKLPLLGSLMRGLRKALAA